MESQLREAGGTGRALPLNILGATRICDGAELSAPRQNAGSASERARGLSAQRGVERRQWSASRCTASSMATVLQGTLRPEQHLRTCSKCEGCLSPTRRLGIICANPLISQAPLVTQCCCVGATREDGWGVPKQAATNPHLKGQKEEVVGWARSLLLGSDYAECAVTALEMAKTGLTVVENPPG